MTVESFLQDLKDGPYAWPGGYPKFFIMADGEVLSFESAKENWELISAALLHPGTDKQWEVLASDINWEDEDLYCVHSGKKIPPAYGEDSENTD